MTDVERPYSALEKPGRKDATGLEWWACDPYPTWYRWDEDLFGTRHLSTADYDTEWADGLDQYMDKYETCPECGSRVEYGWGAGEKWCRSNTCDWKVLGW